MYMICKNLLPESERRRPPCYNGATADGTEAAQRLGTTCFTYMNIYYGSRHSGCQHCQRQELAKYAVVRPRYHCRQVAVTTVMHAIGTFRLYRLTSFMDVNRRQNQHWHKHSQ